MSGILPFRGRLVERSYPEQDFHSTCARVNDDATVLLNFPLVPQRSQLPLQNRERVDLKREDPKSSRKRGLTKNYHSWTKNKPNTASSLPEGSPTPTSAVPGRKIERTGKEFCFGDFFA